MHPTALGRPRRAADLPETARGLVELVFRLAETPAVDDR